MGHLESLQARSKKKAPQRNGRQRQRAGVNENGHPPRNGRAVKNGAASPESQVRADDPVSRRRSGPLTARSADKYELYQAAVQNADLEIEFMDRVYRSRFERRPQSLREDFCGTALVASAWVRSHASRTAVGLDLDPRVLGWGLRRNVLPLGTRAKRVRLLARDVRKPGRETFDAINAFNFSYWIFKTREELRAYFRTVHRSLKREGIFFLDAYGGWEAQEPLLEPRRVHGGFVYVWDQDKFDPITHRVVNHIHFEFKDGSKLEKAFSYDWRYWTLPELQELLSEAGFSDVEVHWDVSRDANRDSYRRKTRADNQPGWLAYLVAVR